MRIRITTITAVTATALILAFCTGAWADGYRDLSARLLRSAEMYSLKKIAVLEFSGKGGADKADTEYAAEKIGLHLAGSKTTSLIERAQLAGVLRETRLSSTVEASDAVGILKAILHLDAVVTGVVFPDGDRLKVLARLIDLRTGRVLLAAETDGPRLQSRIPSGSISENEALPASFPGLSRAQRSSGQAPERETYRDAVADKPGRSCGERRAYLSKLNALLVDDKARYWAIYMKAPGYARLKMSRRPGSEIEDQAVQASFYKRLSAYSQSGMDLSLEQEKLSAVLSLIKLEREVAEECVIL